MNKTEQLENYLLDQIGMLNDPSIMADKEKAKELIERSKAMSELTNSFIDIQKTKLDEQKVKIEAVKVMHETSVGFRLEDEKVQKYLGFDSDGNKTNA